MAGIFDDLKSIAGNFLDQVTTSDTVRDYKHASMLYVANNYELVPKYGFLYHVFFDVSDVARTTIDQNSQIEVGMLVKDVDLPKYKINATPMNAYNRWSIAQTKVELQPVRFTFNDDSANKVNEFWQGYYKYYYGDLSNSESIYRQQHKYENDLATPNSGYKINANGTYYNYLSAIRIYSLHRKRFTEYTLINPVITGFEHGKHDQTASSALMTSTMSVEYEGVLYNSGSVSEGNPKGFAQLHYDHSPSPISPYGGATSSISGPGGLLESTDAVLDSVKKGDFLGAALIGARSLKTIGSASNLKNLAKGELLGYGKNLVESALTGQPANNSNYKFSNIPDLMSKAGKVFNSKFTGANPPDSNTDGINK